MPNKKAKYRKQERMKKNLAIKKYKRDKKILRIMKREKNNG